MAAVETPSATPRSAFVKRGRPCKPLKKGKWSHEEDKVLRSFIKTQQGIKPSWPLLRNHTQDLDHRDIKSCRLRFENHLKPGLRKGPLTSLEQDRVREFQKQHGNQWAYIAAQLPGRTDNMVKNWWNARYRPRSNRQKKGLPLSQAEKTGARKVGSQAGAVGARETSGLPRHAERLQRESLSEIKERVRAVSRRGSPSTWYQKEVLVKAELDATASTLEGIRSSASEGGGDAPCGIKAEKCQETCTGCSTFSDPLDCSNYSLTEVALFQSSDQPRNSVFSKSMAQPDPILKWPLKSEYSMGSLTKEASDEDFGDDYSLGIHGATVWLSSSCGRLYDAQSKPVENAMISSCSLDCKEEVLSLAAPHAPITLLDPFDHGMSPATPDPSLPDFFAELEDLSRPVFTFSSNATGSHFPIALPTLAFVPPEYGCCSYESACLDFAFATPGLGAESPSMQKEV